ncbi:phosphoenolpyruvate--protein phosphotransferase [candidate division KSB1 bacterium]|nr:phosphoenolpyruvate--protein phosphotransferase [candidate division KSB1 bacterium]RQW06744.1 MAG: phosphoenolpyruvate--protein phosphotransferase [candidate division KSB1 bacterium]
MGQQTDILLKGIAASPGIAIGKVLIIGSETLEVEKKTLKTSDIDAEIEKFDSALAQSISDLEKMFDKTRASYGENAAQIFNVHKYILQDPMVVDKAKKKIRAEKVNADWAFSEIMNNYISKLKGMQDERFHTRTTDIQDLKRRVTRYIQGGSQQHLTKLTQPSIVFATELTPSDTIRLEKANVLGFAMDFGARTSHATILARSIGVPAVVGLNRAGQLIKEGDNMILDGDQGLCIINPSTKSLSRYKKRYDEYISLERQLHSIKNLPARTKDGKDIELASNMEFPEEVDHICELHGDGIGLFRTEYLYLAGSTNPTEEQQYQDYKHILEKLAGKPLIIRTFDLGGDKPPASLSLSREDNPFLGVRGVRLYRNSGEDLFRTQIRAILRASALGDIRIMFPMIACVSELRECKAALYKIQKELDKEGVPYNKSIPVGIMIEVPSAAAIADLMAQECDFLSIGTNDLIQYTIAVDRGNKNLAYLYQSYNPAVLRFVQQIIYQGHQQGTWVGMCGEMASDPLMTMVLIGMGLDEFSVSPVSHLLIKEIIRHVEYHECESMAKKALDFSTAADVEKYLTDIYQKKFKRLLHL